MRILPGGTEALWFLRNRTLCDIGPQLKLIEARSDDGELLGVVGFNSWMGNGCFAAIAVDEPRCLRVLVREGARYIFEQLKQRMVFIFVDAKKERWIDQLQAVLGFQVVAVLEHAGPEGRNMVLMEVDRDDCALWERMQQKETRHAERRTHTA